MPRGGGWREADRASQGTVLDRCRSSVHGLSEARGKFERVRSKTKTKMAGEPFGLRAATFQVK